MRPTSKHGLERKFKPWRKGKSSKKASIGNAGGSAAKRPTNASLKNRLRGQKRLLGKLQQSGSNSNDGRGNTNDNDATIAGVEQSIVQLERDIGLYETREREKKNASKYHQVKFIERQKLTRLEKSVKRQLQALPLENDGAAAAPQPRAAQLRRQLEAIALDQLYVAFFPTDRKYVALFATGYQRVADDDRGEQSRRGAWARIKEDLRQGGGRFEKEGTKTWVDLEAAKRALLAMPEGRYPDNEEIVVGAAGDAVTVLNGATETRTKEEESAATAAASASAAPDGRFTLTKELDGRFRESTTGNDYQDKLLKNSEKERSDSDSEGDGLEKADSSSSEDDDDADPLKGFEGKTAEGLQSAISVNDATPKPSSSSSSSSSSSAPSSSSSSSSSEDSSDDDSSDSDSDADADPPAAVKRPRDSGRDDAEDDVDDFFATGAALSTEDVFAQAHNDEQQRRKDAKRQRHDRGDAVPWKAADKSRGFKSQTQSKKDYSNFRARQNRQKM